MSDYTLHLIGGNDGETAVLSTIPINELCQIVFRYRGRVIEATSTDYFEAFNAVRLQLEADELIPFCYGASLNVFPSGMCRDIGEGLQAYRLKFGAKASQSDLVGIFDTGTDVIPAFVSRQKEYFEDWLKSLVR